MSDYTRCLCESIRFSIFDHSWHTGKFKLCGITITLSAPMGNLINSQIPDSYLSEEDSEEEELDSPEGKRSRFTRDNLRERQGIKFWEKCSGAPLENFLSLMEANVVRIHEQIVKARKAASDSEKQNITSTSAPAQDQDQDVHQERPSLSQEVDHEHQADHAHDPQQVSIIVPTSNERVSILLEDGACFVGDDLLYAIVKKEVVLNNFFAAMMSAKRANKAYFIYNNTIYINRQSTS